MPGHDHFLPPCRLSCWSLHRTLLAAAESAILPCSLQPRALCCSTAKRRAQSLERPQPVRRNEFNRPCRAVLWHQRAPASFPTAPLQQRCLQHGSTRTHASACKCMHAWHSHHARLDHDVPQHAHSHAPSSCTPGSWRAPTCVLTRLHACVRNRKLWTQCSEHFLTLLCATVTLLGGPTPLAGGSRAPSRGAPRPSV